MDTCDECGPAVRAAVTVTLPSGRTLTYCNHCANAKAYALLAAGAKTENI